VFAAICVSAAFGSLYPEQLIPQAPLPDRWLLKLVPKNLPPLPNDFYETGWFEGKFASFDSLHSEPHSQWARDIRFRPGVGGRAGEFTLETSVSYMGITGRGTPRTTPLAVHRCLVEFEGNLYTAAIQERLLGQDLSPTSPRFGEKIIGKWLGLGTAIELPNRVWYQARTLRLKSGQLEVREWRLEFGDDPRVKDEGRVTARAYVRVVTEPEGHMVTADATFRIDPDSTARARKLLLEPPKDGPRPYTPLPSLVLTRGALDQHGFSEIAEAGWRPTCWVLISGQSRLDPLLPEPEPPPARLMQPPKMP
jgi:hypothetical protein